jgi:FKBP-type peptidyl-prolyl cis-trans isomerase 2
MPLKKHDFIEVEYTGKTKEENIVFDTTDEKTAKGNNIHSPNVEYGPVVICLGEGHILKGLDQKLEGKELGSYRLELTPEEGFGRKDARLVHLIPTSKFRKQSIQPQPGLQINVDGMMGVIKTVSGGRTIVDFNHPLSGRDIIYNIKINRVVNDDKEKISAVLKLSMGLKDAEVTMKEGEANIKLKQNLPKELQENLTKKITELTGIKKIQFSSEKEQ